MSEHDEQVAVVEYCDLKGYPCYAVPNDGKRSPQAAAWLKAQGLRPGVPDLCIPMARGGFHSLYIEMKAEGGRVTDAQAGWVARLRAEGMAAYVCYGADAAMACIDWYAALV